MNHPLHHHPKNNQQIQTPLRTKHIMTNSIVKNQYQHIRAFSLIELLVVITIIAILIGVLLPALAAAKAAARQVQSESKIHQIVIAYMAFTLDNSGHFPKPTDSGDYDKTWMYQIRDYIHMAKNKDNFNLMGFYRSPLDDDSANIWGSEKFTSYCINAYVASNHPPYWGLRLDQIKNSNFIIASEVISDFDDEHFTPQFWGDPSFVTPSGTNPHTGESEDYSDDRNENWDSTKHVPDAITGIKNDTGGVRGFSDGHAGWIKLKRSFIYTPGTKPKVNWYVPIP